MTPAQAQLEIEVAPHDGPTALLSCHHARVPIEPAEHPRTADDWYAGVYCLDCRRRRSVVSVGVAPSDPPPTLPL